MRRRAKPCPFRHPLPNRKPQKEHIAHRHAKDARHDHKQRHQIRLPAKRFSRCQRNGVVTERTARLR